MTQANKNTHYFGNEYDFIVNASETDERIDELKYMYVPSRQEIIDMAPAPLPNTETYELVRSSVGYGANLSTVNAAGGIAGAQGFATRSLASSAANIASSTHLTSLCKRPLLASFRCLSLTELAFLPA